MQNIIIPHNGFVVCCWEYEVLKSVPLFSAQDMRYLGFLNVLKNKVFSQELHFITVSLNLKKNKQKPQMILCPARYMVYEMLWERSEAPLCGDFSEVSAYISSVFPCHC